MADNDISVPFLKGNKINCKKGGKDVQEISVQKRITLTKKSFLTFKHNERQHSEGFPANMATWSSLAPEIRLMVLDALVSDGCRLAHLVTVSREWQSVIEPHIFSRITLTVSRLADLNQITHRNRHLVKSLYLAIELETYDCMKCKGKTRELLGLSYKDNRLVTTCIENLFSSLSTWEQDTSNLLLDISIYSPSDSEHWFKYLTFEPDVSIQNFDQYLKEKKRALHESSDRQHGWNAAYQESFPESYAIENVFEEIMGEGSI
jgi:hypothetical protein